MEVMEFEPLTPHGFVQTSLTCTQVRTDRRTQRKHNDPGSVCLMDVGKKSKIITIVFLNSLITNYKFSVK